MENKSHFGKFLLLWIGELISSIGGGLTTFGLGVYIYDLTGSAANMAVVTLIGFLPTLLLSVPAGVLADRYDRRLLMMIGDGCSALGIIYILICMATGGAALWQICLGVFISAVFSALIEPSFRATITELLTKEEYSKASGLVSAAGSARYLFSPVIAGFLLTVSDIKLLLLIDICTFFLTVISAAVVRRGIGNSASEKRESFAKSLKGGWAAITAKRGLFLIIIVSSAITLFMGVLQILVSPLILAFSDSKTLGIAETISACGMLASSIVLGIKGIKGHFVKKLGIALMSAGVFMFGFGMFENIVPICCFGFMFFAALPVANNCLDYLARTNIAEEAQGRAWGLIGFISQLGYVVAYGVSGFAADFIGNITGLGVGRGSGITVQIAGICLLVTSALILVIKSIRALEPVPEQK